jgi:peptide-methionine (S)-S-oxide reductase
MIKTTFASLTFMFLCCMVAISCAQPDQKQKNSMNEKIGSTEEDLVDTTHMEVATFGTGCFWCTEAVMESLEGVKKVISGYSGGQDPNPNYKSVCTGLTGHAECVEVTYDPKVITYSTLLEAFFRSHDPTSLNRQGNDIGTQYRSVIFYHNDQQKAEVEETIEALNQSGAYNKPIVTEVTKAVKFFRAEDYHQNYFANNPEESYCAFVVAPKVEKFKKVFSDKLKKP